MAEKREGGMQSWYMKTGHYSDGPEEDDDGEIHDPRGGYQRSNRSERNPKKKLGIHYEEDDLEAEYGRMPSEQKDGDDDEDQEEPRSRQVRSIARDEDERSDHHHGSENGERRSRSRSKSRSRRVASDAEENSEDTPAADAESVTSKKSGKESTKSTKKVDKGDFVKKMREMLSKIFQFYASFGNRCNSRYLKPSQFIKMMLDADIADLYLSQTKLDILFLQACKKSKTLEFDNFLELLFIVAVKKFKKESNADKAFRQLLIQYLQPLYNRILTETDVGTEDKIINAPLSVSTLLVLKMISKPLQVIYRHFFSWEINRPLQEKPSIQKVEVELFNFLKEFEICPQLIAKPSAHSLFTQVLSTKTEDLCKNTQFPDLERILGKDMGETFTFFRFVVYLSRLGIYIFSDANNVPTTHKSITFTVDEKIYLLLERLDISSGLGKIAHLLPKDKLQGQHKLSLSRESLEHIHKETDAYPHFFEVGEDEQKESRLSKILKANRQEKIGKDKDKEKEIDEDEFMYIKMAKKMSKGKFDSRKSLSSSVSISRRGTKKSLLPLSKAANKENLIEVANRESINPNNAEDQGPTLVVPESYDVCETFLDELHKVFECYCSFGEPGNFATMKSAKFMKLMKDALVMESKEGAVALEPQDVDLIFCSVLHGIDPFATQSKKRAKAMLLKFKGESSQERSSSPMKVKPASQGIGFSLFLQCVEAVAICTEKDVDKSKRLAQFVDQRLIPLINQKSDATKSKDKLADTTITKKIESNDHFTGKLMALLKDKTMIEILSVVHKSILPLYLLYCEDTKLINIKKFLQFMKDFGVFPQLISQAKLLQLFHELYALFKNKTDVGDQKEEAIDQHLFVEGLTLIAMEVEYEKFKLTNAQKLILLLERMNDSDATKKLSRYLGRTISNKFDIVSQVRQRFSEHFKF
jgi:hypothetical protein